MIKKLKTILGDMNIRKKLFLIFLAFNLILSIVISFVLFRVSYQKFFNDFIEQKASIGSSLSREMEADIIPSFTHPDMINDPDYEYYQSKMRSALRDEKYVTWIYSLLLSKRDNKLFYAVDGYLNLKDGIWLENDYIGLKFYVDDNENPVLFWNNREYKEDFSITSNGEKFEIHFENKEFKSIYINEEKIFTIIETTPLSIRTAGGIVDTLNTSANILIPSFNKSKEITIHIKFSTSGLPSALPGWPYRETESMKNKILKSIFECKTITPTNSEFTAYGIYYNVIVPIFGLENKCIGAIIVSLSPENVRNFRNTMIFATIGITLFAFIIGVFISYWISGLFLAPLEKLTQAVQDLSSGNMETGVSIDTNDEFGYLASKFNDMVYNIKKGYDDSISLASIRNELMIAKQIQESILPRKLPESPKFSISVNYIPMAQVGGDFYDFGIMDNNKLGVFIADVSGHGVPAAIIASMLKVAFSIQSKNFENPASTLEGINKVMLDKCGTHFITSSYLFLDFQKRKAVLAKAGHPPLIIHSPSKNKIKEYKSKGRLMGVYDTLNSENLSIKLYKNDRLFLFTDGVLEVVNEKDETYGEENFKDFIIKNQHLTPEEFQIELMKELISWKGDSSKELPDDICILVIDLI
ncbi:MAG: SpoIIE family protein phosphatase [Leptospiraceae bacterium]|nr:SpoIIE family protein phosphatase [Leptospiraceae bacterium]